MGGFGLERRNDLESRLEEFKKKGIPLHIGVGSLCIYGVIEEIGEDFYRFKCWDVAFTSEGTKPKSLLIYLPKTVVTSVAPISKEEANYLRENPLLIFNFLNKEIEVGLKNGEKIRGKVTRLMSRNILVINNSIYVFYDEKNIAYIKILEGKKEEGK